MVESQQLVQSVKSFAQGQRGCINARAIFVQYGPLHDAQKALVKENVNRTGVVVMYHIFLANHRG